VPTSAHRFFIITDIVKMSAMMSQAIETKFINKTEVMRVASLPRPLVITNGVFDILHRGHVSYLAQARALGASLMVAVNTDASARRLGKGPDRPLNRESDRAFVIAALGSVSAVMLFDEDTPCELIQQVKPDIYVKGGDYDMSKLEETRIVHSYGGRSIALPFVDGFSTTQLVNKIKT
jgi:D-glycero-beta-D-manno-heptose 1-phosphate adenylyltransferase